MNISKEKSIKIGNILLFISVITLLIALSSFFFPFKENINGLELAFGENITPLATIPFLIYGIAIILGSLIFSLSYFPWGKILLLSFGMLSFLASILLLFIGPIAYGLIIAFIMGIISSILLIISSLMK